jgi:hypothetical protein
MYPEKNRWRCALLLIRFADALAQALLGEELE